MKVAMVGCGYLGLVTAAGIAEMGGEVEHVYAYDIDQEKMRIIERRQAPFYEPGLNELLQRHVPGKLSPCKTLGEAIGDSDVVFLCVPTPSKASGAIDLTFLKSAARKLATELKRYPKFRAIVIKSTVLPGTTETVVDPILRKAGLKPEVDYGLCANPEFTAEGVAVQDFLKPAKTVLGSKSERTLRLLEALFKPFPGEIIKTTPRTAEMVKYTNNALLASRISLINEIANISELNGADVSEVARAVGLDPRIGPKFLNAGCGFGGSCFKKDVSAITHQAKRNGYKPRLLNEVLQLNHRQPLRLVEMLERALKTDLKGKKIAVLGLAFKPGTDDLREAPSIRVINELVKRGSKVVAHDPAAIPNARRMFDSQVEFAETASKAIEGADGCILVTEWPEYQAIPKSIGGMNRKIVIDGRRALDGQEIRGKGGTYLGIGVSALGG